MLIGCVVVERNDNDRARGGKQFERVETLRNVARHPRHLAVVAACEPLFQSRSLFVERCSANDADFLKSFGEGAFFN